MLAIEVRNIAVLTALCVLSTALTGCGGSGGDESQPPSAAPPPAATYTITAAISGLSAAGLVLQNNGGGSVTVAANASTATIASNVTQGTAYAVTVQTQPAGQSCVVANGAGTVSANVSNVTVTCTTVTATTYAIGGTITGLTGNGLVVRLNANADASFNASPAAGAVSFGFAARLATGAQYAVTLASMPTDPVQGCGVANGVGTIGTADVSNIAITCTNSAPFTVSGSVSGLTGAGLKLRMGYSGAAAPAELDVTAGSSGFIFPQTIPANGGFSVAIGAQPAGQSCTLIKGRGFSIADVSDVAIACVANAATTLSGTYTVLPGSPAQRGYVNFNTDGTFTTALIHNDASCNASSDMRNGNGVEYGTYRWNQATGALSLVVAPAIDTNGQCGFADAEDFSRSIDTTFTRNGNTLVFAADGGPVTLTAVASDPVSLVGAFLPDLASGSLLVFEADGTYLFAETQGRPNTALDRQERGCYTVAGSTVIFTIEEPCRPDGFAAYDYNGGYGLVRPAALTVTLPFSIPGASTLIVGGAPYTRTQPN